MSWTTPRTWVVGETVTAAIMNTHIRDNLNLLLPMQSASATDTMAGGTNLVTGTVTFPFPFVAVPRLVCQFTGSPFIEIATPTVSTTDFDYRAFSTSGANVGGPTPVSFDWIAFGAY